MVASSNQRPDLLLVNPGNRLQEYGSLGSGISAIEPPLWAALTAAFVREKGHSVQILDAEAEGWGPAQTAQKIADVGPLLAGIVVLGSNPSAASTPKMTATIELVKVLKRIAPGTNVIVTGLHPSALPERTLRETGADFVGQGECFDTFAGLVEAVKAGRNPRASGIPGLWYLEGEGFASNPEPPLADPDGLPMAVWELLDMGRYRAHNWHCFGLLEHRSPYAVIFTSLGCPYNCNYCNINALYNGKPGIRLRSPEKVVEEIDHLVQKYGVKNIKVLDELFALREDRVVAICDLIIERGYDLNIWAYARVDTVNENMLRKMKAAGINWVAYGIESASETVRKGVVKKLGAGEYNIVKAVDMAHAAGINVMGNFIFGLPDDDLDTMKETLELAKKLKCEFVNFYVAMAYPGSHLYDDSVKQGVPLPETWHGFGQYSEETLPLPTKHLPAEEVLRFRDQAFKEYFNDPGFLEMIAEKFGREELSHIREMLGHQIHRRFVRS